MKKVLFGSVVLAVALLASQAVAQDQPATTQQATPKLTAEIAFGTGVEERALVGEATDFPADVGKVYCWTKVTGADSSMAINHLWFHDGQKMASVSLSVQQSPWRTWSYKTILPEWTGDWKVVVADDQGVEITSASFTVGKKPMTTE